LDRGVHTLTLNNAGGDALNGADFGGVDGAFAVDRLTEGIDYAAKQGVTDGHRGDTAGGAHFVADGDTGIVAHDHDTNVVRLQVEGQTGLAAFKLDQLAGAHVGQPVDQGDPVTDGDNVTDAAGGNIMFEMLNLF
jgi:hypothetical protein